MEPAEIAAGVSAVAALFKGVVGFFGGHRRAQAERYAAEQAGMEAGVTAQQAASQGEAAAAQGAVQAAANGGGLTGSALAVISQISQRATFNARAAAYRGLTEQRAHLYNAGVAKAEGNDALISGILGAAGDAYGGLKEEQISKTPMADGAPRFPTTPPTTMDAQEPPY